MRNVAVLGGGSWGTALAVHLARIGHTVRLWARDPALVAEMRTRRANPVYLADTPFPETLTVTDRLDEALAGAAMVVVAVPSHGLRAVARQAAAHVDAGAVVLSATKGLEDGSLLRMSEVLAEEWPHVRDVAVLSGPSFAAELARSLPTVVVVASRSDDAVRRVQEDFRSGAMRLYASRDVVGVELGGALKNVMAIAAGAVEGMRLGHNARAALITRGLAEMSRLAVAAGGDRETLAGLAGMGDLVLDLHRLAEPQPARRAGAGRGPAPRRHPGQHAHGRRGCADHACRAGARRPLRRRAADCRAGGRAAAGTHHRGGRGRGADGPSPAGRIRRAALAAAGRWRAAC